MADQKKIRVLRVQSRICVGGPALNTILLTAHLDPERYESKLVGGRLQPDEKTMEPFAREKGVDIEIIGEMGRSIRWWDDFAALRRLMRLIRAFRPHIVHTHTAKAGAIGRLAAFLCRVPIRVHTFHGHTFHGYFSDLVTYGFILVERVLAMLSHRIIAISPRQREDLTKRFRVIPHRKCTVVRLGFELDRMAQGKAGKLRGELDLGPEVKLAGIIARLVPVKNHALLLEAIALWHQRQPLHQTVDVRFLFVGDGVLRARLEPQAVDLGIEDLVIFTGWRRDLADIYADLDLNIIVSKNEGTPVTLIEGLAAGVPVLSTDVGGVRDFVDEDMGTVVANGAEAEEVADALQALLARPNTRLEASIQQRIREQYGVARLVGDINELYTDLLTTKNLL